MWWHKLVAHWSKRDYIEFSLFYMGSNLLCFSCTETDSGETVDLPFMAFLSLAMIPVEFLIIIVFQKYSSNLNEIMALPSLIQANFDNDRILESGKILVFFYAEWCPFCRSAFHHINSLSSISYKVYRVDLSDEENSLWTSLSINRIPTLIAFHNGKEFWRREATYMIGLRKVDFKEADSTMKTKEPE